MLAERTDRACQHGLTDHTPPKGTATTTQKILPFHHFLRYGFLSARNLEEYLWFFGCKVRNTIWIIHNSWQVILGPIFSVPSRPAALKLLRVHWPNANPVPWAIGVRNFWSKSFHSLLIIQFKIHNLQGSKSSQIVPAKTKNSPDFIATNLTNLRTQEMTQNYDI